MTSAQALWGVSNGVLLFAVAGTFWLGLGLGPVSYRVGIVPWLMVLAAMLVGLVWLVRSALAIRRRSGFRRADLPRHDPATHRILTGLRVVGVIEALLVGGAMWACNALGRPDLSLPALALAVSLHFAPLAYLLKVPVYYVTAAAGMLVTSLTTLAPFPTTRPAWLGLGMAVVMWGTAMYLARRADNIATTSVASLSLSTGRRV